MTVWFARVRVTLKSAVNDPQGLAIRGGLHQLGYAEVTHVRAGKYFDLQLTARDRATAERTVAEICGKLLANPVIEDYTFDLADTMS
jgi:phosphoribosylformylglycinamidine synthase subunit PurS